MVWSFYGSSFNGFFNHMMIRKYIDFLRIVGFFFMNLIESMINQLSKIYFMQIISNLTNFNNIII